MLVKIEYPAGRSTTFEGRWLQQTGLLSFFVDHVFRDEEIAARSVLLKFRDQ